MLISSIELFGWVFLIFLPFAAFLYWKPGTVLDNNSESLDFSFEVCKESGTFLSAIIYVPTPDVLGLPRVDETPYFSTAENDNGSP